MGSAGGRGATSVPGVDARFPLRRRDYLGIIFGTMLLGSMLLTSVVLVRGQHHQGQNEARDRFTTRTALAASFVKEYVEHLAARETEHAVRALAQPEDQRAAFERVVGAFDFDVATLLDSQGRVIQYWPPNDDLLGKQISSTYAHLQAAVDGRIGVSNVVPSAAASLPITAIAVPVRTPGASYVFSGGFKAQASPLGAYFDTAIPLDGGRAYLVDAASRPIVSGKSAASERNIAPLAPSELVGLDRGLDSFDSNGTRSVSSRIAVDGTPWDVVLVASVDTVYESTTRSLWRSWVILGALGAAALAGMVLLVRVAQARAAAAGSAHQRGIEARMLRSVISNNQSLIYVKDLDGRYLLANEAFERAFAVKEGELLGRTDEYLDPELAPTWKINDERAREGLYEVEEWSDAPDGRHWYETMKFPLFDSAGLVYATCGVSLDVTERNLHTVAIEEARDAALSAGVAQKQFAASASHELRTPTTSILGFAEAVLESEELSAENRGFLEIVYRNAQRLSQLIDDLLIIDQAEVSESMMHLESTALLPLVERVMSIFASAAQAADIALVADHASEPSFALVDPLRLEQALLNLVSNAIKFTPHGGEVRIGIVGVGESVAISVADTGIGIDPDDLDRIFDRFFRTKTATDAAIKGSGLGLAIARRMIEAQNGQLRVTSTVGVGSTFTATLPAASRELEVV